MAFKCSTQKQRENTGQRRAGRKETPMSASADHGMSGSTCLGADMLLQLLKKYSLTSGMKQAITVGELLILYHLISLLRLVAYSTRIGIFASWQGACYAAGVLFPPDLAGRFWMKHSCSL